MILLKTHRKDRIMKNATANGAIIRKDEKYDGENVYSYELIMKEGDSVTSWRIPLYTINVKMTTSEGLHTESSAADAFSDATRAIKFYERLVNCLATPIDLIYVLDDETSK